MSAVPRLVGLAGPSGSGKDTAAEYLRERHRFRRIALADPLKGWVQTIFGLSDDQLWGPERNAVDLRLGRTPREVYQSFGDACRDIDPDVLIRPFRAAVRNARADGDSVVCTDVRTASELALVRAEGGLVYRIRRSAAGAPGKAGEHRTETELCSLADSEFDGLVRNDGSLRELHDQLDRCVAVPHGRELLSGVRSWNPA